jgi:hypothetical protein
MTSGKRKDYDPKRYERAVSETYVSVHAVPDVG